MTLVSVVMPVYNTAHTVGSSMRSVMGQSFSDWELLVVDDASTDESWEQIERTGSTDDRIRTFRSMRQLGAAGARNCAIAHASGQYIAFLDSDDMWLPHKLERQLRVFTLTHAPLTYTSYYKIAADYDGEASRWQHNSRIVYAPAGLTYRQLLRENRIGCLTAMYDRGILGTRLMPDLRKRQDYALWLSILRDGGMARGLAEPLALYRQQRHGSLSGRKLDLVRHNWRVYRGSEQLSVPHSTWALANTTVRATLKSRI